MEHGPHRQALLGHLAHHAGDQERAVGLGDLALARHRLEGIDFAPRAAMLEKAAGVVVEMVKELRLMRLEEMSKLNERLRVLEAEADRLILELHREIYSGRLDAGEMFLLKEFFEILEKAIDRCREAGVVAYQIVLKNS